MSVTVEAMVRRRSQGGRIPLEQSMGEVAGHLEEEFARKDLQEEIRQSSDRLISHLLAVPEDHPLSDRGYHELLMELYSHTAQHVAPQEYTEQLRRAIASLEQGLIGLFPSISRQDIPDEQKLARIVSIYNFLELVLEERSIDEQSVEREVDCQPELIIDRHWRAFILRQSMRYSQSPLFAR